MTDLDDLIARQRHVVDLHEAGLLEPTPSAQTVYEQDKAILARLVSLRDAGKELPDISGHEVTHVIVDHPNGGDYPVRLRSVLFTKKIVDALRAHAVAVSARVLHYQQKCDMLSEASFQSEERAESAESRVRELEAEREAMMAKLREPTEEMLKAWCMVGADNPNKLLEMSPMHGTGQGDFQVVENWKNLAILLRLDERFKAMTAAMGVE